jgi:hypothetical protein
MRQGRGCFLTDSLTVLYFIILLAAFIMTGCRESEEELPKEVAGKQEMIGVLTDIQLAQSSISVSATIDSSKNSMQDFIPAILKQHKMEEDKFLESLKYYASKPEIFQEIYDSVITRLSKLQGELQK